MSVESQAWPHSLHANPSSSNLYGPEYYRDRFGAIPYERNAHWLNFFGGIADELIRSLRPARVFDAGCAWGFLVEAFWDRGVEARGSDISQYAIANVRPDMRDYCAVASVSDPIPHGPYDLVTCIEVLEHVSEEEGAAAIERMAEVTDQVLFSSTPDDFEEETHINVRPAMYWLRLFERHGFYPDALYDASFVSPHAMLLRRQAPPPPETMRLFCELLRSRKYRAAFLARHLDIERLDKENAALRARLEEAAGEVRTAAERIGLEVAAAADLRMALEAAAAERDRLLSAPPAPPPPPPEPDLRPQLEDARALAARSEAEARDWMERTRALSEQSREALRERDLLRRQLDAVYGSPGWRLIMSYRRWLNSARNSRAGRALVAPADWAARRLASPASAPAPAFVGPAPASVDAAPVETPARPAAGDYEAWIRDNEPSAAMLELQRRISEALSYRPLISVLAPVYRVPVPVLREMIDSVIAQTYDHWELCLSFPVSEDPAILRCLRDYAARDSRIRVKELASNGGISANSNQALTLAGGEFLALLDHDDTLAPFALFEVAQLLNHDRQVNFIYSDKDQLTADGSRRVQPLFKPAWSPELMLNANYLTHLSVLRTAQVREIGGWRSETDGAQDWDLFLRVIQRHGNVRHIPKVLYHWRQLSTSVASRGLDAKPYASKGQIKAVQDHCDALGLRGARVLSQRGDLRIEWPASEERISLIVIGGDGRLPLDTGHVEVAAVREPGEVEAAVRASRGDTLVLLDEAVTPADKEWLRELTVPLRLPGVGAVGGRMIDPRNGLLRHCGLVITAGGRLEYLYAGQPEHVCEQFGAAGWYRDFTAVSGACLAIRRETWDAIGGMTGEPGHPRLDVNLCLKLRERGLRIVYNPYARFEQIRDAAIEQAPGEAGAAVLRACFPEGDPYFHRSLDCGNGAVTFRARSGGKRPGTDYTAESEILVSSFDAPPADIERSRAAASTGAGRRMESVTWFVPDFTNAFYGGICTILRFADSFQRRHGVRSHFCLIGRAPASRLRAQITEAFPELGANCEVFVRPDARLAADLPATDAAVATLWTTAYAALRFNSTRAKFYFIQDDEALFYPAGSTSALVEATYRFGFRGICNTVSLLERYRARGGEGAFFAPCVDPAVFHREGRAPGADSSYTLFCYGRPHHPRNCFELLAATLRRLKHRMGDRLTIVTAGDDWDPRPYGLDGVVHNLGLLNYHATGALYRACDAGLVLMMTRHPSYLPLELMACGALVITNDNPDTRWLLKDGANCLLAPPTAAALAGRIEAGLLDAEMRGRIVTQAASMVDGQYRDWEQPIEEIYRYMAS